MEGKRDRRGRGQKDEKEKVRKRKVIMSERERMSKF